MIAVQHQRTLRIIYNQLQGGSINWAITGSLGFSLHGMGVEVGDIDLQTDERGAYEIERIFAEKIVRKVSFSATEKIASHFGELNIAGMKVEIMGGVQKRLSDGSWEAPIDVMEVCEFIPYGGMTLPVLSLIYEEQAYRKMGRIEKANQIKAWLKRPSQNNK